MPNELPCCVSEGLVAAAAVEAAESRRERVAMAEGRDVGASTSETGRAEDAAVNMGDERGPNPLIPVREKAEERCERVRSSLMLSRFNFGRLLARGALAPPSTNGVVLLEKGATNACTSAEKECVSKKEMISNPEHSNIIR